MGGGAACLRDDGVRLAHRGLDRELSDFINRLREFDRPVVVVFFGDHQPALGSTFNNLIYSGEDQGDPAHSARVYQTPYMIWANYDVAGNDQVSERLDIGINSLAAVMLDAIGAPMTDCRWHRSPFYGRCL